MRKALACALTQCVFRNLMHQNSEQNTLLSEREWISFLSSKQTQNI